MKQKLLFGLLVFLFLPRIRAQESTEMTLQQCIHYGLKNSLSIQRVKLDVLRSEYVRSEALSGYLPQVSGSGNLMDNLKLQTSILPGEVFNQPGKQIAVKFGTKYNLQTGIDANQLLFNQQLIYALKAAKENTKLSELNQLKTSNQLTYDIASAFYGAQVTKTQTLLIQANLAQLDSLLQITTIQLSNGFARQLDVDRLKVNRANLATDLENAESGFAQQIELLKFLMGMPENENLRIVALKPSEIKPKLPSDNSISSVDLDILNTQKNLQGLNIKQLKGGLLPTLSMNYRYAFQFIQDDLRMFSKNANWFPTSFIGVNLQVPIFDGFATRAKVNQAQVQYNQFTIDEQLIKLNLETQQKTATLRLKSNIANLESRLRNIDLAKNVLDATRVQYVGGIASMSDLLNAETSLSDAQTNYLSSLIQVKIAELELLKINGSIADLIK